MSQSGSAEFWTEQFDELKAQVEIAEIHEHITAERIEAQLLALAEIGGTQIEGIPEQPVRYSVNRVALTEIDYFARSEFIQPQMEGLGMEITDHPLGLVGTLKGTDESLPPLLLMSHTDSVPEGDMYDGVAGVTAALEVIRAMQEAGITPKRTIYVAALTGEESAGYGMALFGSKGMFHGLSEEELDSRIEGGKSIRDMLGPEKSKQVRTPLFGTHPSQLPMPGFAVELHVEQFDSLEREEVDLGIVEAIAAANRFYVVFKNEEEFIDLDEYPYARYLRLSVEGTAGHSGATPMGLQHRADGLTETAKVLEVMDFWTGQMSGTELMDVGPIDIAGEALNKIPGRVESLIRFTADNELAVDEMVQDFEEVIKSSRSNHKDLGHRIGDAEILLETVSNEVGEEVMKPHRRYRAFARAVDTIKTVQAQAELHSKNGVVGTVGTYSFESDGSVVVGIDIRGKDVASRADAISDIEIDAEIDLSEPLVGAADPAVMDGGLVDLAHTAISRGGYASVKKMVSPAGHDAQNTAHAGIPTVMIFTQSNAEGAAHNPKAWTDPENLTKGYKALADVVYRLAA